MKWIPAKLGAEPKKIGILVALVVVAGFFYFTNRNSGDSPAPARPPASTAAPGMPARQKARAARVTQNGLNKNLQEFRPSLKPKDVDRSAVDPTLHTALLAKLQDVKAEGVTRSLFEFSTAPAVQLVSKEPAPIKVKPNPIGPMPLPPPQPKVATVEPT